VGANVVGTIALFSIAAAGLHGYRASFWTLPTLFLSEVGAAAGIGVINCFGNLGGFLGPYMVGFLSNDTGSYRSGMLFLGGCALMASVFVLLVRVIPAPVTSAATLSLVALDRKTGGS
jgi:ACS family tartrate transporter-like MFS transporter